MKNYFLVRLKDFLCGGRKEKWFQSPPRVINKKENPLTIIIIVATVLSSLYIILSAPPLALLDGVFIQAHREQFDHQSMVYRPLSVNALNNLTYSTVFDTVTLRNGKYERNVLIDIEEGSYDRLSVMIVDHAFGDLDGDGDDDAVVVLGIYSGGSGYFYYLVPVFNERGTPKTFNSGAELGDRIELHDISIRNGIVAVKLTTQGLFDPLCCPTSSRSLKYYANSKKLYPCLSIFELLMSN